MEIDDDKSATSDPTTDFEASKPITEEEEPGTLKLLKFPNPVIYPIKTGFTFESQADNCLQFFEDFRDGLKGDFTINSLEAWLASGFLSTELSDYFSNPVKYRLEPGHDASRFEGTSVRPSSFRLVRPASLRTARGTIFIYGATQEDIADVIKNRQIIDCYYIAIDDNNEVCSLVHDQPNIHPVSTFDDIKRPPGMDEEHWNRLPPEEMFHHAPVVKMDTIYLFYSVARYANTPRRLSTLLANCRSILSTNGSIEFIMPITDNDHKSSEFRLLYQGQLDGQYPKMCNLSISDRVYVDHFIPVPDLQLAADNLGLVLATRDLYHLPGASEANRSVTLFTLTVKHYDDYAKELYGEQAVLAEQHLITTGVPAVYTGDNFVDPTTGAVLPPPIGVTRLQCLELEDEEIRRKIIKHFGQYKFATGRPLEFADFAKIVQSRIYVAPKLDGINAMLFEFDGSTYIALRDFVQVFRSSVEFPNFPPLHIELFTHDLQLGVDYEFCVFDIMEPNLPFLARVDKMKIYQALGRFRIQEYTPATAFAITSIWHKEGCDGIVVIDCASPYEDKDFTYNNDMRTPARYIKKNPTVDLDYDRVDWNNPLNHGYKEYGDRLIGRRFVSPLFEVNCDGVILRVRYDKKYATSPYMADKIIHGYERVTIDALLTVIEPYDSARRVARGQEFSKLARFEVPSLFPEILSPNELVADIEKLNLLVATYPHPLYWTGHPEDLYKVFKLRQTKWRSLPTSNDIVSTMSLKMLEHARAVAQRTAKRSRYRI